MASKRKTLIDLIDQFTPVIRKAFLKAIADIKDDTIINSMVKFISEGQPDLAVKAMGISEAAMRPITAAIETAFETGGVFTAGLMKRPIGEAKFVFDLRNSRAEAWLRDHSSKLVTNITQDQMRVVRETITEGVADGLNPRNIALDIVGRVDPITQVRSGGILGLNEPQKRYVVNARKELETLDAGYFDRKMRDKRFDSTVRKAIASETPLTQDQINKLTGRYSDNLLKLRGETIGRTEAIASLNQSQIESMKQMVETGSVAEKDVKRIWDSAGDDGRTRHSHLEMDGQEVEMNAPFTTPDGYKMMYPGDSSMGAPGDETINCRCRVKLKVDWLAKARAAN